MQCPELSYMGIFIPMEINIEALDKSKYSFFWFNEIRDLYSLEYHLEFEEDTWRLSGRTKHAFNIKVVDFPFDFVFFLNINI